MPPPPLPPSARCRAGFGPGWLAASLGLGLLAGVGIGATAMSFIRPAAVPAAGWWPLGPAVTAAAEEDDMCRKIAAHAFWRAKVTPGMVSKMADTVTAATARDVVWIDDSGACVVTNDGSHIVETMKHGFSPSQFKPAGVGKRHMPIVMQHLFKVRPDRALVLQVLLKALDVRDFRG